MTKAERRELQEKQRAAKAALKAQQTPGTGGAAPLSSKQSKGSQQKSGTDPGSSSRHPGAAAATSGKDPHGTISEDPAAGKRGPRIFTHFGLPKPIGHTVKGDIHPAVVRLGLLFSEFKICGANARCIATLTAFKNVRGVVSSRSARALMAERFLGHSRLYHTPTQHTLQASHDPPLSPNHAPRFCTTYVCLDGERDTTTQAGN